MAVVQSYALGALREGMSYVSGMEIVCQTPDIVKQLFSLVDEEGKQRQQQRKQSSTTTTTGKNILRALIFFLQLLVFAVAVWSCCSFCAATVKTALNS